MGNENNVVVDTNVLLSAALNKEGTARQAFHTALEEYVLLQSHETFDEFVEVINREKFKKYISPDTRDEMIADLYKNSDFVEIKHTVEYDLCRDPKDNKFLELAVSGVAKYIISGDKDLLVMGEYQGVKILSPRDFLERERNQEVSQGYHKES